VLAVAGEKRAVDFYNQEDSLCQDLIKPAPKVRDLPVVEEEACANEQIIPLFQASAEDEAGEWEWAREPDRQEEEECSLQP